MAVCNIADYRRITRDFDSFDGDVSEALNSAQKFVEGQTHREFDVAERKESLKIHRNGRVYPHSSPIVSVSVPAGAVIAGSSVASSPPGLDVLINQSAWFTFSGYGDYAAYAEYPYLTFNEQRPRLLVTYVGGYADGAAPESLKKLVAEVARCDLQDRQLVPAGATTVTSGDVTVTGDGLGSQYPATVWQGIRAWTRRET